MYHSPIDSQITVIFLYNCLKRSPIELLARTYKDATCEYTDRRLAEG